MSTFYGSLREKIGADNDARRERYAAFERIYAEAQAAGLAAGIAHTPRPMTVEGYAPIADGVCGFAWVTVRPGNCSFAKWLKSKNYAIDHYGGGVDIWIRDHDQSYERKLAHASKMEEVLKTHIRELGTDRIMHGARLD